MSTAAISHYVSNVVRYDPQAVQLAQQRQQQLRLAQAERVSLPDERTLEGELLNKQDQGKSEQPPYLSEDEFLARHQEQQARSTEGYRTPVQQALAVYQTTARITHPADVDRVGYVDVYV